MLSSVRARLILLLLGFLLLVTGSVVATFVGLQTAAKDALVINLAGRQRMLIQQMTKVALQIERGEGEHHALALRAAARTFDQTLSAFISGGQVPYLLDRTVDVPATRRPDILAGLRQVRHTWGTFHSYVDVITAADPSSPDFAKAVQAVERLSPDLVQRADEVVRMYEVAAAQKVARLRWVQVTFFVSALALLAAGALVTQGSVIAPLRALGSVAERIGGGDLDTPVEVTGPREIAHLVRSFDTMRTQLQTSQAELITWAEELEVRVAQRTRELAALYGVSREISSRLDIDHVLRSVTEKARELLGGEIAILCLLDETGQTLNLAAASGPQGALRGTRLAAGHPLATQVLTGDGALPCGVDGCAGSCGMLRAPLQTSHLAAPLRVGDRVIGALCVGGARAEAFSGEAADLLTKLANSAAIALENARLYEQAERVATLEERQRIAAEMHDGHTQTLSYLHLQVDQITEQIAAGQNSEALTSLERIREALVGAVDEVRANIADLSTSPAPSQVLPKLLADTVRETANDQGVDLAVKAPGLEKLEVASDVAEQVRRIVQEAVTNACRHAEASRVQVRLEEVRGEAVIAVEDDGRGFEPDQALADGRHHFGLRTMRARAARIGGRLAVESAPGHGTRITLHWSPSGRDEVTADRQASLRLIDGLQRRAEASPELVEGSVEGAAVDGYRQLSRRQRERKQ